MAKKLLYLLSLLSIFLFTYLLQSYKIEPFESISLHFNDASFYQTDKEISKDIVFVAVDEQSVNEFGRWPWSRDIIAKGVDQLQEADIVLFDMIFSEHTQKENDLLLADSISKLQNSVCGFFLRQKSTQKRDEEALDILDDSSLDLLQSQIAQSETPYFVSAPEVEINIPSILQSCTLSGNFSTLADSDQLLRAYPISVYYQNTLFASLAVQALRLKYQSDLIRVSGTEVSLHSTRLKLNDKGFVKLNYYKKEQYKIISFLDLYEKKVQAEYFKDKIVILGITEIGAGDVVSTPVGFMYGPLLHYTFLSNFLQNQLIIELPKLSILLMFFLTFVPLLFLFLMKKVVFRILSNLLVFIAIFTLVHYFLLTKMYYIDLFYPLLSFLLSILFVEVLAFRTQENSSKFMKEAFSAYLSVDLLKQLVKNPDTLSLGGEKKELSILFSDIRGFTTLSESMDASALVTLLNRYFTPMTNSVLEHKGMLDKYIGDAIMAFFNAPVDVKNHANQACSCALDMVEKLKKLNQELQAEELPSIKIGIGINTAEVVVGNMGSDTRFNYTVMGDGVNLASRIEGLTKNYGVNILITEYTVAQLSSKYLYRKIEAVIVKGKEKPVLLYELLAMNNENMRCIELYNKALEAYIDDEHHKAQKLFTQLRKTYDDAPAKYYLQKIADGESWCVNKMLTK